MLVTHNWIRQAIHSFLKHDSDQVYRRFLPTRLNRQKKRTNDGEYPPPSGTDGGDVVVVVDPSLDSLLHLHERERYAAGDGKKATPGMQQARGAGSLTGKVQQCRFSSPLFKG